MNVLRSSRAQFVIALLLPVLAFLAMAEPAAAQQDFYTVAPCRIYDSRMGSGPLDPGEVYTVTFGGVCGVPADATGVAINVTVISPEAGTLVTFPAGSPAPAVDLLMLPPNALAFRAGKTQAKNFQVHLGAGGAVSFRADTAPGNPDIFQLVVDVAGYYRDRPILNLDTDNSGGASPNFAVGFVEDAGPVEVTDVDVTVTDADDTQLDHVTVTLTNRPDGAAEILAADVGATGIVASYTSGTGVLLLQGPASLADFETVLETVTYDNSAATPDPVARVVTFVAFDSEADGPAVTSTVTPSAANDRPTITAIGDVTVNEDTSTTDIPFTVDDAETAAASLTVTATSSDQSIVPDANITLGGSGASRTVKVTPVSNANGTVTISVTINDTSGTPNATATETFTVTFTAVNDAPSGINNTVSTSEGAQYTFTAVDFGFTDPDDNPANALASVVITTLPAAGTLTLSGAPVTAGTDILVAAITAGNLKFAPAAGASGSPYASFTFQVRDDGGTANGGVDLDPTPDTLTINVGSVNSEPAGTNNTVTTLEDAQYTFTAADFGFTDPNDTPANALASVVITTLPAAGTLTLSGSGFAAGTEIPVASIGSLVFTPAANASGSPYTSFTFQVRDDGGTASGGVDLDATPNTLTVNVTSVNDAPAGTNGTISVSEDAQYTFTAADFGFTDPTDTPANALASVVITSLPGAGNLTLSGSGFAAGTEIPVASIGSLVFTPAANASGSPYTSFTFQVRDNGGTANSGVDLDASANVLTVNVTARNDAPAGTNNTVTTLEETQYTLTVADFGFTDPNDTPANALASVVITTLPAAGSLTLSGSAFAAGTEIPVASITAGNLKFVPAANGFGTPYASFTFQVRDDGGTANGGVDLDASANTLSINVTAVNDAPAGADNSIVVFEDTQHTFTVANFGFTDPNDSPANTLASVVITSLPAAGSLTLSGSAFAAGTEVSVADITAGNLKFIPAANASDSPYASFTFQVRDNGGTANSGIDLDPSANTLTINVTAINDAPAGIDSAVTTPEDIQYTFTAGDFGFSDPNDSPANALASVVITSLPGAGSLTLSGSTFTAGTEVPVASLTAGNLKFLGAANAFGSPYANFTFQVRDNGGTANGGVNLDPTPNAMVITVTPVPDPPVAEADTFETFGNTELRVDLSAATTPHVLTDLTGASGVLNNDSDPIEMTPITLTNVVGCADLTAPFVCTTANGGQVTLESDGSFSYLPPQANPAVTATDSTDSFQYTLTNGVGATATGTVNLTRREVIWYVDPNADAGGDGRSHAPFQNFAAINGVAGSGDPDNADDYILVHDGTFTGNASIELEAGQRLVGQGVGLTLPLGSLGPKEILAATTHPQINNASGDVIRVTSAVPARIAGLSLSGSVNAIDMPATGAYTGSGTLTIENNIFRGAGAEGIDINAGATGTLALNVQNNSWIAGTHTGNAVDVAATNGALQLNISNNSNVLSTGASGIVAGASAPGVLTITGFTGNTVHQSTAGTGISINAALFDATPGGAVNRVYGGNTRIGTSGDGVGGAGLALTNVTGDLAFGDEITVGDLDVYSAGAALTATSIVSGVPQFRLTVTPPANGGSSTLVATAGAAVDIDAVTADLRLSALTSTGGLKGVSLVRLLPGSPAATFPARFHVPSGINNSITTSNAAATAFRVDQSNAAVTYQGTITTTAGTGVSLTSNTGSTMDFSGTLTLSTGANPAFTATGGGTVTATDPSSTLTATTATALNVTNTALGSSGLTFRSITSGTGSGSSGVGIALDSTGTGASNGGLTVTGNSAPGTGGTIQHKTGADGSTTSGIGIFLNNTKNVSLNWMQLNDFDNSAIAGRNVQGFTLQNSVINGVNGTTNVGAEGPIAFGLSNPGGVNGLQGTGLIRNTKISGGVEHNLEFYNQSGSMSLTIAGINAVSEGANPNSPADDSADCIIEENSAALGGDGIQVEMQGTSTGSVIIDRCLFRDNKSQAVQVSALNSTSTTVTIDESWVRRFDQGNEGFILQNGGDADLTALVSNNHINGFGGTAIFAGQVAGNATAASELHATISGNVITQPTTATNHAIIAFLTSTVGQLSQARVRIDGNNITNNSTSGTTRGIIVDTPDTNTSPVFHATVTNNTVAVGDSVAGVAGIVVQGRQSADTCASIGSNTVTFPNGTPGGVLGLRARQTGSATYDLEQSAGCTGSAATVLACRNPGSTTEVLGTLTVVPTGACLLPNTP